MRLALPMAIGLLATACGVPDPPDGGAAGWPNIPDPGLYEATEATASTDECAFLEPLTASTFWTVSTRDAARDAFALTQDGTGNRIMCGYDRPGYICFEADVGTWLTGGREIAVWMDGSGPGGGPRFDLDIEAFETCASAGGGCPDPCESTVSMHFERTVQ